MRYVYVVRGSEDGILDIYGSARKAAEHAVRYVEDGGNAPRFTAEHHAKQIRSGVMYREIRPMAENTNFASWASVETFPLR